MMKSILKSFKREVRSAKEYIALINLKPDSYQRANIDIVKFLTVEEKTPGVYITLNKPHEVIEKGFKKEGVDTRLIIYIDSVSKVNGDSAKKIGNCLYIGNPERLSDMSVAADQAVNALPGGDKFIILDSLNTLLLYNHERTVMRFAHYLATKMREWKIKGIVIILKHSQGNAIADEIVQFCDFKIDA